MKMKNKAIGKTKRVYCTEYGNEYFFIVKNISQDELKMFNLLNILLYYSNFNISVFKGEKDKILEKLDKMDSGNEIIDEIYEFLDEPKQTSCEKVENILFDCVRLILHSKHYYDILTPENGVIISDLDKIYLIEIDPVKIASSSKIQDINEIAEITKLNNLWSNLPNEDKKLVTDHMSDNHVNIIVIDDKKIVFYLHKQFYTL